jgi:hypothetical protein
VLPRAELAGKTVIDPMNYALIPGWSVSALDSNELTSSELVQRQLAGARVVKALHCIGPKQLLDLFRPAGVPDRTALPLSGDDPDAKKWPTYWTYSASTRWTSERWPTVGAVNPTPLCTSSRTWDSRRPASPPRTW